eukprot:scaffold7243_cov394-Prasinococcus_capsulatus_cf.AAC.10
MWLLTSLPEAVGRGDETVGGEQPTSCSMACTYLFSFPRNVELLVERRDFSIRVADDEAVACAGSRLGFGLSRERISFAKGMWDMLAGVKLTGQSRPCFQDCITAAGAHWRKGTG